MTQTLYKICSAVEWSAALAQGVYTGSVDDVRDGFIHFSFAHQARATAAKYFPGRADLVLIAVDSATLGAALRLEPSRGGELFPHLYGPLHTRPALRVSPLPWNGTAHDWPSEIPPP